MGTDIFWHEDAFIKTGQVHMSWGGGGLNLNLKS